MATFKVLTKNLSYFGQQFSALLGNTSTSVKILCLVIFFSYFLSFSDDAIRFVSVTPGTLLPPTFWVWTALTFCFLEIHFWEVCVDLITVGLCGKLIEPLWGQLEMVRFFFVVNFGVALLSTLFYYLLYTCTFNTDILFNVHIHGLAGFIAGLSVAVKQAMPDHVLIKTPLGKWTNRNVPLTIVVLSVILYVCGFLEGTNPTMFICGILTSWTYLRFYQRHTNGSRGDMADSFSFSSFFPTVIQPPISAVAGAIHSALVRAGICRRVVRRFDLASAPTPISVTIPPSDPHDMERRRQIALKALSERLSKGESIKAAKRDPRPSSETVVDIPAPAPPPPAPTPPPQPPPV